MEAKSPHFASIFSWVYILVSHVGNITMDGWTIDSYLGDGSTSKVFSVKNNQDSGEVAACKLFQLDSLTPVRPLGNMPLSATIPGSDSKALLLRDREFRALHALTDVDCVPKLVLSAPDKTHSGIPILLKTPIGIDVRHLSLSITSFAPLVKVLQIVHSRNMCHNDVCPDNMFAVKEVGWALYKVFLNDFGSVTWDEEIEDEGYFNTRVLFYDVMGAAGDLKALVRSIFYITQNTFVPGIVDVASELDWIMCSKNQFQFWEQALTMADDREYASLHLLLQSCGRNSTF